MADLSISAVYDAASLTESVSQEKGTLFFPGRNLLTLQAIGDVNWSWLDSFPGNRMGLRIYGLVVMLAGADTFILRDGSLTGPIWFAITTTGAYYNTYMFNGVLLRPVMKATDQTVNSASKATILFEKP